MDASYYVFTQSLPSKIKSVEFYFVTFTRPKAKPSDFWILAM